MGVDGHEPDPGLVLPPCPVARLARLEPLKEALSERLEGDVARFLRRGLRLPEPPRADLGTQPLGLGVCLGSAGGVAAEMPVETEAVVGCPAT